MSENRQIARMAGVVAVLTFVSRITGLVRDVAVGYLFGTGLAADAFFVAFRIPNLLRRFVAEGAMSVAFIPVFTDYLTNRSREETIEVVRVLATSLTVLVASLTLIGVVLSPMWVSAFAPGFAADPEKAALTIRLTQLLFPYVFLVSLVALLGGLLNAFRHFVAPALSPVLLNLSMIAAAWWLCPLLSTPVYGLAYGVLLGGVLQLVLQIRPLVQRGIVLRPMWNLHHPAVRRVLLLMAPTVFGAAVYQVNVMMDTVFASVLPAGSVSYLWYADRVFEFPLGVFAVAIGTAALPSFSTQAARRAYTEMRHSLAFAIDMTSFITIPASVGIGLLALPITSVLFQRGAFTHTEVDMTAWALQAFAVGLWAVSVVRVLVPAFYALNDTRTPVVTAAIAFVANLLFSVMFMGPVYSDDGSLVIRFIAWASQTLAVWDLRHAGLALSTSLAAGVNLILLAAVLSRRLHGLEAGTIARSLVRNLIAALVMVPVVYVVAHTIEWDVAVALWLRMTVLLAAMATGAAVFLGTAYLLGAPEVGAVISVLRRRLGVPPRSS